MLFDPGEPPAAVAASWFGGGTATQRAAVARGLHPLGLPLGAEGTTCGACVNFVRLVRGTTYFKCALRHSRCRATDIAKRWRGCVEFKARPDAEKARVVFAPD